MARPRSRSRCGSRPAWATSWQDFPGGDLPAGADSAWRPGFVAGFHEMLDQLRGWLDGTWTLEDNLHELAVFATDPNGSAEHQRWIGIYRRHIREHCPPASPTRPTA